MTYCRWFVLTIALISAACGGGGGGAPANGGEQAGENSLVAPLKVEFIPFDIAGTPRAQPSATMGALEAL